MLAGVGRLPLPRFNLNKSKAQMEGIYMSYNSKEITLPSGATAIIKDARMLLVRDRNKVLECAGEKEGVMQAVGMQNGLIAVMVESWSFELLEEALPAQTALFPSLVANETNVNDPKVNTANFNA